MKITDKFAAILGAITVISGILLVYMGQPVGGISGAIVGGMFLLKGFGYDLNQKK